MKKEKYDENELKLNCPDLKSKCALKCYNMNLNVAVQPVGIEISICLFSADKMLQMSLKIWLIETEHISCNEKFEKSLHSNTFSGEII